MPTFSNHALCQALNNEPSYYVRQRMAKNLRRVRRMNRRLSRRWSFWSEAREGRMKKTVVTPKRETGAQGGARR